MLGLNRRRSQRLARAKRRREEIRSEAGDDSHGLPPIAKDAHDLRAIRQAVDDAAAVSATLWFSYIFVTFYIAVAAGAVTHEDLLLERPVKLPFLNIDLPLLAFFFLAPILFLIVHAYTLVHFVLLGRKARRFHDELYKQLPGEDGTRNAATREALRRQLPSNVFVQFLAGPSDIRDSLFGVLLKLIAWTTLVIGPVVLFLLLQIQFLPYHNQVITWVCRGALALDLLLIWFLWQKILGGRGDLQGWQSRRAWRWMKAGFGAALSTLVVLLSWTVATFPGERWDDDPLFAWKVMPNWDRPAQDIPLQTKDGDDPKSEKLAQEKRKPPEKDACGRWQEDSDDKLSLHDWLFAGRVDRTTRRRVSWRSNTLVLPGFNIFEAKNIDEPQKVAWKDQIVDFRGRNLEHAIMCDATLGKADLTGAQLRGAVLGGVRLQGARLDRAQLQAADLPAAQLQGASFDFAQLQGASLLSAQLHRASLSGAQLQRAVLDSARLQGARLGGAQLQNARLEGAHLQGAHLDYAQLRGASLYAARLQNASLHFAQLQGASLYSAELQGADLRSAQLQGASLYSAELQGARLDSAQLQGASLLFAQLQGASLDDARLQGASLLGARLQGASLDRAQLQGASLDYAQLQATSLRHAILWRSRGKAAKVGAIQGITTKAWAPVAYPGFHARETVPWTAETYAALRATLEELPKGARRVASLKRIEILACPAAPEDGQNCDDPPDIGERSRSWQAPLEKAKENDAAAFAEALSGVIKGLACDSDSNAGAVLKGLVANGRIAATDAEAPKLIDNIMNCSAYATLDEDDKTSLLRIKNDALKRAPAAPR
jgi:uncharacterized protein YjbI with pentapeptide repeats